MKAIHIKSLYFKGFNSVTRNFSFGIARQYGSACDGRDVKTVDSNSEDQFLLYQQNYMNRQNWPDLRLGPIDPSRSHCRFPLPGEIGFASFVDIWQRCASKEDAVAAPNLGQDHMTKSSQFRINCSTMPLLSGVISTNDIPLDRFRTQINTLRYAEQYFPRCFNKENLENSSRVVESQQSVEKEAFVHTEQQPIDSNLIADDALQFSMFNCPTEIRKHFASLFPDRDLKQGSLSVIVLAHRTQYDMAFYNSDMSTEREQLMESFVINSKEICQNLRDLGFWADFIDPFTGTPHLGQHTNDTLFEVDPRNRLFGLQIEDMGCCRVLRHTEWGTHVFAGMIFTDAPSDHPVLNQCVKN